MSTLKPLVLVTGVSGFVGSHVTVQLLETGYAVRGTARTGKAEGLRRTLASKYPKLEIVTVDDIAADDLKGILKDVGAVVHVASPLAGRAAPADALNSAVEGSLNVLRQSAEAGINKFVLTSSWGTTMNPDMSQTWAGISFTAESWGKVTREDVLSGKQNPLETYLSCKLLAEKEAWEFADSHHSIDLTTINPPFIYGPWLQDFPQPTPDSLGSNALIYGLIAGDAGRPLPPPLPPFFSDVRDVAKAHVTALSLPKNISGLSRKRFLISSGAFSWSEAVEHLSKARPDLNGRFPSLENAPAAPGPLSTIDSAPAAHHLQLTQLIDWHKSVEDTVDNLLEFEKAWKAKI